MTDSSFIARVNELSEQTVQLCYHCHKCTAGCPVAPEMEFGPDRILRLVQLGEKERVLASGDIWVCASCETCGTRCPNEINIAEVMDALRAVSLAQGFRVPDTTAPAFHSLFLSTVRLLGRMHEASLLARYMVKNTALVADMSSGAQMFLKGKLPLLPHRTKKMDEVKRIFRETGG